MARLVAAIALVLVIIYVVPFMVYGSASAFGGLKPPTPASPGRFLAGVLVTKVGTAVAFVVLFAFTQAVWGPRWLLYALVWFAMFALGEVGETVSGRTGKTEALLGIVAELIYAPLSAYVTRWLVWRS